MTLANTSESDTSRQTMLLLSDPVDIFSHCCRIVLIEKGVDCAVRYISKDENSEVLGQHNPYSETPTLLDRDVSLYNMWVILDYLDERFPYPPLMPADPITRAKTRLALARFTRDWMQPIHDLQGKKISASLKKSLCDGLVSLSPILSGQTYFLGNEYTLVDAYLSALLWRLPSLGVELPKQADAILHYGQNMFERPSFRDSLSDLEVKLR